MLFYQFPLKAIDITGIKIPLLPLQHSIKNIFKIIVLWTTLNYISQVKL